MHIHKLILIILLILVAPTTTQAEQPLLADQVGWAVSAISGALGAEIMRELRQRHMPLPRLVGIATTITTDWGLRRLF
ncbi:MAG TPA: hypothetical protein VLG71_01810 [Candidatus Limnocylindria bacterium]|nr:hypothetical protein [Candidatus Limnocylindria bacterium]